MNANQMRIELKRAYKGASWAAKVDKMSDNQVLAVYRRLQSQNKI